MEELNVQGGPKNGLFLRVDNFTTFNGKDCVICQKFTNFV